MGIDVEVISESWVAGAVGIGCWCKWIRGFGLPVLIVSWVWVAGASGFWIFWVSVAVFFGFG